MRDTGRRPARWIPIGSVFLIATASCVDSDGRSDPGVSEVLVRDSAGIEVVEVPGSRAREPIGWEVEELPDLQIGSVASGGPDQFFLLERNVLGLPDGRIAVMGMQSGELRFFDRNGTFLNQVGSIGDGPGEFRQPILVPYVSGDSILVYDNLLGRYTLLADSGEGYRNFLPPEMPLELASGSVTGATSRGLLMTRSLGTCFASAGDGMCPGRTGVRWTDIESGIADTVFQADLPVYLDRSQSVSTFRRVNVPFHARPVAAISAAGFFVTGGSAPEVRMFDFDRNLVRIMRLVEAPRPITPEDLITVSGQLANRAQVPASEAERFYRTMELPSHLPVFQRVMVDPLGWVWTELYRVTESEKEAWMLFDPDGVPRGTVDLPGDLEVTFIGPDYLLGVWRDELGVEYVRRYRVSRED